MHEYPDCIDIACERYVWSIPNLKDFGKYLNFYFYDDADCGARQNNRISVCKHETLSTMAVFQCYRLCKCKVCIVLLNKLFS